MYFKSIPLTCDRNRLGGGGGKGKNRETIEGLIQLSRKEELVADTEVVAAEVVRSDWILHIF